MLRKAQQEKKGYKKVSTLDVEPAKLLGGLILTVCSPWSNESGSRSPDTSIDSSGTIATINKEHGHASGHRSTNATADGFSDGWLPHDHMYPQFLRFRIARAPIREAGRVTYLGESSNLSVLVNGCSRKPEMHYPLPRILHEGGTAEGALDHGEVQFLQHKGAFLLPPPVLCDQLVESYFKWIAPIIPVINRNKFMRQYRDREDPPSLLLLQAILLAGSRVCTNFLDTAGSTALAAGTFYARVKALYDANYEHDRITIVQALILMGWYWEGPESS